MSRIELLRKHRTMCVEKERLKENEKKKRKEKVARWC